MDNNKETVSIQKNDFDKVIYDIKKNTIPVVFLDTSILINLVKDEYKEINDKLIYLAKTNRVIFLSCSQEEEFIRNNRNKEVTILNNFLELTRGYYIDIDDIKNQQLNEYTSNVFKYIKEYDSINNQKSFEKYLERLTELAFSMDTTKLLRKNELYVISGYMSIGMMKTKIAENKDFTYSELSNIAEAELTFDHALWNELTVEARLIREFISEIDNSRKLYNLNHLNTITDKFLKQTLLTCRHYILNNLAIASVEEYIQALIHYVTLYVYYTPAEKYISSRLYAYIFHGKVVKSGDSQDIWYASNFFPYCDFYFTDKKMCNIIKEMKLDKKFKTEVLRIKDLNYLIDYIESNGET